MTRTSTSTRLSPPSGLVDAEALRSLTLHVYGHAEKLARERGIIVADTKFEFGRDRLTEKSRSPMRC